MGIKDFFKGYFNGISDYTEDKGKEFNLPKDFEKIDSSTFYRYKENVENINAEYVKEIGNNAFNGYENLERIDCTRARSIGDYAFKDCQNLNYVNISAAETIGKEIFAGCDNLQEVFLKDKKQLEKIWHEEASKNFQERWLNKTLTIYLVEEMKVFTFGEEVVLSDKYTKIGPEDIIAKYIYQNKNIIKSLEGIEVEEIPKDLFRECISLVKVALPKIEKISKELFIGCKSLKNVSMLSANVIEDSAFSGCSALENVNFGAVERLGNNVFEGCTGLRRAYLPSVSEVGANIFKNCEALEEIVVADVEECKKMYESLSSEFEEKIKNFQLRILYIDGTNEKSWIDACAYSKGKECKEFYLPCDIVEIGKEMFNDYKDDVVFIDAEKVSKVCDEALEGCKKLETVNLPSATDIGNNAFNGCEMLETVMLSNIESIGNNAFDGCKNLNTIQVDSKEDAIKIYNILPDDINKENITFMDQELNEFEMKSDKQEINDINLSAKARAALQND